MAANVIFVIHYACRRFNRLLRSRFYLRVPHARIVCLNNSEMWDVGRHDRKMETCFYRIIIIL